MRLTSFLPGQVLALLVALFCVLGATARATTFTDKNLAQLVHEAEQVFIGTLISRQSRKLPGGVIVSDLRFSDIQSLKGAGIASDIVLLVLGGEVDGERLEMPGVPQLQPAARYLVFSRGNGREMFPVVGGPAGIFRIVAASGGASPIVLDWSAKPLAPALVTEVLGSTLALAQEAPQAPITLDVFIAAIKARLAGR